MLKKLISQLPNVWPNVIIITEDTIYDCGSLPLWSKVSLCWVS